jgi:hypothetical protein
MNNQHNISLSTLVKATAALKLAKDTPVNVGLCISVWTAVMTAHRELQHCVDKMIDAHPVTILNTKESETV